MQRNPAFAELYEILDSQPNYSGDDDVLDSLIDLQYALSALKHRIESEKEIERRAQREIRLQNERDKENASRQLRERKQATEQRATELRKKFQFYKCGELPFAINQYILDFITTPHVFAWYGSGIDINTQENARLMDIDIKYANERNHTTRDDYLNLNGELSSHPPTAWEQILNHTFKKTFVAKYFEFVRDGLRKMHIVDLRVIQKGIFAYGGKSKMEVANNVFNLLCGENVDYSQTKPMKKQQVLKVILAIKRMDKRGRVIGGINYYNEDHWGRQFKHTPYKYVEAEADSDDDDIDM